MTKPVGLMSSESLSSDAAVDIDLHQIRCSDFLIEETECIDEKVIVRAGYLQ